MKSQGMQENQQITFMSDGADTVRNLQAYLHPLSEHVLDWFHVAMRVTVLKQQAKSMREEDPDLSDDANTLLERAKHFLWHGNVDCALETLGTLSFDLERHRRSPTITKLSRGVTEFDTYIQNNRINQVISKRFVKKQQMQWTPKGAHLLLQTRTRVLDDELEAAFRTWYPSFRPTTAAACQWQPKTAHFWQLKTAHFGERAVGRSGRSPVDAHRACWAGRRERSDRSPGQHAPRQRTVRHRMGCVRQVVQFQIHG